MFGVNENIQQIVSGLARDFNLPHSSHLAIGQLYQR